MVRLLPWLLVLGCGPSLAAEAEEPPGDPIAEVSGDTLFRMGVEQARRGDLIRAEQYLAAAISRGVPEHRVLPILLQICVSGSRFRAALGHAEPYLARNPDDWSLRYFVASIQRGLGDLESARSNLKRVIRTAPDQPAPHYLLGVVLADASDNAGARQSFERYLALAPEGPQAVAAEEALAGLGMASAEAPTSSSAEATPSETTEEPPDPEPAAEESR